MTGAVDGARRRMPWLGDGWFPNPPSPQDFGDGWQRVKALAQEMGQDAKAKRRCVYTTLNINDNVAQAESLCEGLPRRTL